MNDHPDSKSPREDHRELFALREPLFERWVIGLAGRYDPAVAGRFDNPLFEAFARWRAHRRARGGITISPELRTAGAVLLIFSLYVGVFVLLAGRFIGGGTALLLIAALVAGPILYRRISRRGRRERHTLDPDLWTLVRPDSESRLFLADLWMLGLPSDTLFDALLLERRRRRLLSTAAVVLTLLPVALCCPLLLDAAPRCRIFASAGLSLLLASRFASVLFGSRLSDIEDLERRIIRPWKATLLDTLTYDIRKFSHGETWMTVLLVPLLLVVMISGLFLSIVLANAIKGPRDPVNQWLVIAGAFGIVISSAHLAFYIYELIVVRMHEVRNRANFADLWQQTSLRQFESDAE